MTTIAYKKGVIAIDSRITSDGVIRYDDYEKFRVIDGYYFFLCGKTSDWDILLESCLEGRKSSRDLEAATLYWDGSRFYFGSYDRRSGFWKELIPRNSHFATGSGAPHALTAMDLCQSAGESIKAACLRDTHTGGILRTFDINRVDLGVVSQGVL